MRYRELMTETFNWSTRTIGDDVLVEIDVAKIMASWAKDRYSYFDGPQHPNAVSGRIERFGEWVKRGEPINASELCIGSDGEAHFINGRHRFYWLAQHGVTRMPVAVPPEQADEFRKRFG